MTQKIIIGTKTTKNILIKGYLLALCYAFVPFIIAIMGIVKFFSDPLFGFWTIVVGSLITLIIIIFFTPMIGIRQYLEVSASQICYYYSQTLTEQFKTVWRILMNKEIAPAIVIETKAITNLSLTYQQTMMQGLQGYCLVLNFLMNDGVLITISMDDIKSQDGIYIQALDLLSQAGVQIIDKDQLRLGLTKDSIYFQTYIQTKLKEKSTNES